MRIRQTVALLAAILASTALYAGDSETQLTACYQSGSMLSEKYACMGSTVKACNASTGASIAACANAETKVWRALQAQEIARIEKVLSDKVLSSGPCKGNQDGCSQGLKELVSESAANTEQKCSQEAGPKHNAGHPEMAKALCHLREAAGSTMRVLDFGENMGQHASN